MRILHLVNHCRLGHGNAHVAVDLACQQALSGEEVTYASEGGEFVEVLEGEGVRHERLRQHAGGPLEAVTSLYLLVRLIQRLNPDIVHAHMMSGAILGAVATRLTGCKLVTTVHNSFDRHSAFMRIGHRIVAVSEAERSSLLKRGFPRRRLDVVLNGPINSVRQRQCRPPSLPPLLHPNISTVCGLHPRKGVPDILAAFTRIAHKHADAHLYIVGDGPNRQEYESFAARSVAGDRIQFLGTLSNPAAVLDDTDIFVLASYADPAPLVIPEARGYGCAVVASRVGGIPELLDDGVAGALFEAGDVSALANELDRLLSSPECLSVAKKQSQSNCARLQIDRVFREYQEVYRRALGR